MTDSWIWSWFNSPGGQRSWLRRVTFVAVVLDIVWEQWLVEGVISVAISVTLDVV